MPKAVTAFMNVIREAGYEVYVVGGAIRDLVLGKATRNWDFTTNATPEVIQRLFPDSFYHNIYGTVTVPYQTSHSATQDATHTRDQASEPSTLLFEITPFRLEGDYSDARHPQNVQWAKTLAEDLARRDFTINALAYDGKQIIDMWGGQDDLRNKLIRTVGDPDQRFQEDALRLLRAVRLASELGFMIEDNTRQSIKRNANMIKRVSWERIRTEFFRILESPYPADGILLLRNVGLLYHVLPELDKCFHVEQKSANRHHIFDVGTHSVMALKHCASTDVITRFATLIHDIGKAHTFRKDHNGMITFYNHEVVGSRLAEAIADRFRLSREQKDKLVRLVAFHMFVVSEKQTDSALRRFIRNVGKDNLEDMFALRRADRLGGGSRETSWRTEDFKRRIANLLIEPFTVKDLKVNGHDVMKTLNIKPSPQVGDVLNKLFEKVVNKEIENDREKLIHELAKMKSS
jgi:tRNA nucleotidyltransferase/poly(A) polymerase